MRGRMISRLVVTRVNGYWRCSVRFASYFSNSHVVTCEKNEILNSRNVIASSETLSRRFKYTRKQQPPGVVEDDDSISESVDPLDKSISTKKYTVTSLRMDLIIKAGAGMARNKVETAFYESRTRLNGKKILKKSVHVNIGDEIDVIHGPSPSNPDFLVVTRIEVLSATPKDNALTVHLKRHKNLIIENYDETWRGSLA